MKLKLNSGLFNVTQPCGYWTFGGLADSLEEDANGEYEESRGPGRYEVDYPAFLEILAKRWVSRFSARLAAAGINAGAEYTGRWSPKEYNFRHDEADFTLAITKAEVKRLASRCLADGRFPEFLRDTYSSRDGFWSYLTDDAGVFAENAKGEHGEKEYGRAVWQALNFVMFPDEAAAREWNDDFLTDAYESDFSEALYFAEKDEAEGPEALAGIN
jgi:hypothetical protein